MKHCPYCSIDYPTSNANCPACQAADAEVKCDNCGTIHKASFCPNCGFGVNDVLRVCPKCGKKTKERCCPDCGFNFTIQSKSVPAQPPPAITVNVTSSPAPLPVYRPMPNTNPEGKRTVAIALGLVLFAPVGVLLMWIYKKKWNRILKIVLSAVSGIFFFACIVPAMVSGSKPATTPDGYTIPAVQEVSGHLGNYEVEILHAAVEKKGSYSDDKVIIITYKWTNNTTTDAKFEYTFDEKVYQDGILCEKAYAPDLETNADAAIKPGASIEVKRAYSSMGTSGNIEIQISERYSTKTKVVKEYREGG